MPQGITADIMPKALIVTGMTAQDKPADGTDVASLVGGTLSGLVGVETLGFAGQIGRFDNAAAGTAKPVTVSGLRLVNGTGLASNYRVENPTGLSASIIAAKTPAAFAGSEATAAAQNVLIPVALGGNIVAPQMVLAQQPTTPEGGKQPDSSGAAPAVRNDVGMLPLALQGMALDVVGSGVNLAVVPTAAEGHVPEQPSTGKSMSFSFVGITGLPRTGSILPGPLLARHPEVH